MSKGGTPLVHTDFEEIIKIKEEVFSVLLTAIIHFTESSYAKIKYFELKNFIIILEESKIQSATGFESIISYAVLHRKEIKVKPKKKDHYINKKISPLLKEILSLFAKKFRGKDLSEVSQFESFENEIANILI